MTIHGVTWPNLSGDVRRVETLSALAQSLVEAEGWSATRRLAMQERQLAALVRHAAATSPGFSARLKKAGLSPRRAASFAGLARLPILDRRALQRDYAAIRSRAAPVDHGPVGETRTSGSSGEPVTVARTALNQLFWMAHVMREHLWNHRDFSGTLAIIRANLPGGQEAVLPDWGPPANLFVRTGPSCALPIDQDVAAQAAWLAKADPQYLLTYPSNLDALLGEFAQRNMRLPRLRQVRSIGETLSVDLRERVRRQWDVEIADVYSSQELGYIAVAPAGRDCYAVMENLIVEILDADGEVCVPGQIGRVVVTDLYNFATPLVRYDLGDYAEAGPATACGVHALGRIVGRERNMLRVNGERRWPLVGFHLYREIADIRQYQIAQKSERRLEMRLVVGSPLDPSQEKRLRKALNDSLRHEFEVSFSYYEGRIPSGANGKFEEFVCEIPALSK